jgi:hypothetical protein
MVLWLCGFPQILASSWHRTALTNSNPHDDGASCHFNPAVLAILYVCFVHKSATCAAHAEAVCLQLFRPQIMVLDCSKYIVTPSPILWIDLAGESIAIELPHKVL